MTQQVSHPPVTIDHDPATDTTVAVCNLCTWRHLTGARASGWTQAAIHLKAVHGDLHAAATARDAARHAARFDERPQSPETFTHGTAEQHSSTDESARPRGRSRRRTGSDPRKSVG